jgi:hypothetical protein
MAIPNNPNVQIRKKKSVNKKKLEKTKHCKTE